MFCQIHLKHFFPPRLADECPRQHEASEEGDELALLLEHGLGECLGLHGAAPVPAAAERSSIMKQPPTRSARSNLTFQKVPRWFFIYTLF